MNDTFADRLRRLRDGQGRTIADLAREVSCSEGTIRNLEGGKVKSPSLRVGLRLADALHIDPYALAFGENGSITGHLAIIDRRLEAIERKMGEQERSRR